MYKFRDLPEGMQVLIYQLTQDYDRKIVIPEMLKLGTIPLSGLPEVAIGKDPGDERDETYARKMIPEVCPPILIANSIFLDGKHRVYSARHKGYSFIQAIDLTGIVPIEACHDNGMGKVKGFRAVGVDIT